MTGTTTRESLHIGLSLAPTWLNGAAWRREDSNVEALFDPAFAIDVAQRAEAAKLDFVFRPDALFVNTAALPSGPAFASLDPTLLMAAVAGATRAIGLLTTLSTTFWPPYVAARQLMSLDWISGGRAGWNIVTALDGNANFGLDAMPAAEERYARAAEFTDVVRRLWASFPGDAVLADRETGRFADAARVTPIDHAGAHYRVAGPLNVPRFGAGRIPLVQAGASQAGRDFAAGVADAVFASSPDIAAAAELRTDLRRRAEAQGRRPDDVRVMPGLSLTLAATRAEARDLFAETQRGADTRRAIDAIKAMVGLDVTDWPAGRAVRSADLPDAPATVRSRTHADLLRRLIERDAPTVAELLVRPEVVGSAHWRIVGTPQDAAAEIAQWAEAGAIDGFVALPGGSTGSMHMVLEEMVPCLADRGLFRTAYGGTTFADHLLG
ncbi:NtaA/DmoA family FMN-dependent monooxygenase [Acuticoccus sp. I52.16.1]|uniref:NtaA/DmoA family FMN-dependent monooxygenase n=1 Tax=Acuticoccus sp. I52.16.1 TaxID=2928472 RepID=UPI001FD0B051|nr:NtaA/DmoA family FMN-dependent monooxygenase [Acuticoccus sp. I52.16.1]UOM32678.1 NtaA/DmoA family FMN-dependent monooxygenase [Acuticoccus sp. I52.16.1]